MPLQSASALLRGGLDLITPAMAMPAGRAIAAMNYEPEARGYRRIGGFERFDGRPSPSLGASVQATAARRAAIGPVPGTGPVRGVHVYAGALYAFRDGPAGGAMFKATMAGWVPVAFGHIVGFRAGSEEFVEGGTLTGETSRASARIARVVLRQGAWTATGPDQAEGYLVVSGLAGQFAEERGTGSSGGSAQVRAAEPISLSSGGRYDFIVKNFYGAATRARLYAANGTGAAFEFDGANLVPIRTGNTAGNAEDVIAVVARDGSRITTRTGDFVIVRTDADKPSHVSHFANHLFLSFDAGSVIHSGVGEPLDFRTVAGAGEIGFGVAPTGLLPSAATSLVIFGQSRVEYLTGTDAENFDMKPISDAAGAARWSVQMAGDAPLYLDEAGLRKLSTTAAFGDWRLGTLSQLVEPLFRAKRDAGATVAASLVVKAKDQYRLFFDDGSGIVLYLGRRDPEIMPIRFPSPVFCACAGEFDEGEGERMFVGSENGFVYEIDKGPSFDGAPVPGYLRLGWNDLRAPMIEKRFHSARIETDSQSDMTIGITYHVDYSSGDNLAGELRNYAVAAGSPDLMPTGVPYDAVDWTLASAGEIRADDLSGLGRNIALTILSDHASEDSHTLTAMTLVYGARRQLR